MQSSALQHHGALCSEQVLVELKIFVLFYFLGQIAHFFIERRIIPAAAIEQVVDDRHRRIRFVVQKQLDVGIRNVLERLPQELRSGIAWQLLVFYQYFGETMKKEQRKPFFRHFRVYFIIKVHQSLLLFEQKLVEFIVFAPLLLLIQIVLRIVQNLQEILHKAEFVRVGHRLENSLCGARIDHHAEEVRGVFFCEHLENLDEGLLRPEGAEVRPEVVEHRHVVFLQGDEKWVVLADFLRLVHRRQPD